MKVSLKSLAFALCLCALVAKSQLVAQGPSQTQATGVATPRIWLITSNQLLTPSQYLGAGTITNTNVAYSQLGLTAGWYTNQNVYALAPTFMAPVGNHAISLTGIIQTTNNLAHASNIVVNIYPAYDITGGTSASVSARYGQLFGPNPILTWTIAYVTNGIFNTNIPTTTWEPATALGFTISNGCASNTTFTLFQTDTP